MTTPQALALADMTTTPEALIRMLQPGGIVPIDIPTTAALVAEVQRLRDAVAASHFTSADMASAAAQGFRDGVASVPQAEAVPQTKQALKDALYALQVPHVACQVGLIARCMCRKCVVKRGDDALASTQQAEAVPGDVVRDAERYRWLRDQTTDDGIAIVMKNKCINDSISYAENINKHIDAAIAQQKGGV